MKAVGTEKKEAQAANPQHDSEEDRVSAATYLGTALQLLGQGRPQGLQVPWAAGDITRSNRLLFLLSLLSFVLWRKLC